MMIWWSEHIQNGATADGQTDWNIHRAAWSQLKELYSYLMEDASVSEHGKTLQHWQGNEVDTSRQTPNISETLSIF